MTAQTDFDRLVEGWLGDAGPSRPSTASVAGALATARTLDQRRGLRGRLAGADPWPRGRASIHLPRGVLALVAVGLLVLALAGLAAVGARLVDRVMDPVAPGTFSGPYPMPVPAALGVQVGNGTVIVFGREAPGIQAAGSASNTTEQVLRLDVDRNELTPIGTTPGTVVNAIELRNGDVLVVLPGVPARAAQSVVGILRPSTGEFTVAGQTASSHLGGAAVQLGPDDPRVLLVGGGAGSTAAELFDPGTNQFTPASPTRGLMLQPRAVRLDDGGVLVIGEWNRTPERFDPATETWSPTAPMAASREGFSVIGLDDGRVLVVGGVVVQGEIDDDALLRPAGPSVVADTAEIYDPSMDSWTTVGPLVHPRWMHAAHALGDGSVLIVGGTGSALASAGDGGRVDPVILEAERFDPGTNTFLPAGSLSLPRLNAGIVGLANGEALVLGSLRPIRRLDPDGAGVSFERYGAAQPPLPPAPVETPAATPAAVDPAPAELVGRWVAEAKAGLGFGIGSGPSVLTMTISEDQLLMMVSGRPDPLLSGDVGFDVSTDQFLRIDPATGRFAVVADSDTGESLSLDGAPLERCARGDVGGYSWKLGTGTLLVRGDGRDACESRPILLDGGWVRSAVGESRGGPAIVETVDPPLALDLPPERWLSKGDPRFGAALSTTGGLDWVRIWQDPVGFADGCDLAGLPVDRPVDQPAGVEAFLAVLRNTRGLEIADIRADTVGAGTIPATRVELQPTGECGANGVAAWQPPQVPLPDTVELLGGPRTIWLFEAQGSGLAARTMLVEVVTRSTETQRAILDSIRPVTGITTDAFRTSPGP